MRNPALYNRALTICQLFTISFYISISIVVYYYCGQYVATPAFVSSRVCVALTRHVTDKSFDHYREVPVC